MSLQYIFCWNIKQPVENYWFFIVQCELKDVHFIMHWLWPIVLQSTRKNTQQGSDTALWVLRTSMVERAAQIPPLCSVDPLPCFTFFSTVINYLWSLQPVLQNSSKFSLFIIIAPFLLFFILFVLLLSMHVLTKLAHIQCLFTFNAVLVFWWQKWRSETHR